MDTVKNFLKISKNAAIAPATEAITAQKAKRPLTNPFFMKITPLSLFTIIIYHKSK
jgi:hypothetical protein